MLSPHARPAVRACVRAHHAFKPTNFSWHETFSHAPAHAREHHHIASQRTDFSSYDLWNDLCKATHEVNQRRDQTQTSHAKAAPNVSRESSSKSTDFDSTQRTIIFAKLALKQQQLVFHSRCNNLRSQVITAKGFEGKDIVVPDGQRFPLLGLPYDKFLSHVQTNPEEGVGFVVL